LIDDVLVLSLQKICMSQTQDVAILPKMRLGHPHGVQVTHPDTGYELWLNGHVDYGVINYDKVNEYVMLR
jgi:hypothetical protein